MHYGDTKAVDLRQIVTTDLVFGLPREGDINGSLSLVSCSAYNSVLFKLTSLLVFDDYTGQQFLFRMAGIPFRINLPGKYRLVGIVQCRPLIY